LNSSLLRRAVSVFLAFYCTGIAAIAAQNAAPLKLKETIPLSGVEGRIDHFAFDRTGERLFVCALGNNIVEVLVAVPHPGSQQTEVRCYQIE